MQHILLRLLLVLTMASISNDLRAQKQPLLIGTNVQQRGIFASSLDLATGAFSPAKAVGDGPRPGFLALHPALPRVYAVTREPGPPSGGVRAFEMNTETLELKLLGQQSSGDEGSTHLAVTPYGKSLVVANYGGGSTALLPIDQDGQLGELATLVKHAGSSVNKERQSEPHAHGIAFDQLGRFALVADLGTDEVIVYRLDNPSTLTRHAHWDAKPGAGPRHLAFHPNGRWLYCINELDSTLSALSFDNESGGLKELHTVGTLPDDFDGWNSTAEVVVHPNGKFVYISNRGHDSTAVFAIDADSGRLSLVEFEPTRGGHPRFIGIEPSGQYLIAANRDANNLVSFRIDTETGKLTATGHEVSVSTPVCVVFPIAD